LINYFDSFSPDSLSGSELDQFLALGWYRMHQTIFTTSHVGVKDPYRVHWLRYSLAEISDRSSCRRIRNRNRTFHVTIEDFNTIRKDHEELYSRYRRAIDFGGALSIHDSLFGEDSAEKNIYKTKCISVFDQDRLIAGGYFDVGVHSAASILHFFDPLYGAYSLGKYLMLLTVDFLKSSGYEYYYPGYLVAGLAKMNYKLFMGREVTQYFEPETGTWKYFKESILVGD